MFANSGSDAGFDWEEPMLDIGTKGQLLSASDKLSLFWMFSFIFFERGLCIKTGLWDGDGVSGEWDSKDACSSLKI